MTNMFKKIKANNIQEYLNSIPKDRKADILFLHNFIKKTVPKLKPHLAYNMLGYGTFKYLNYKKDFVDWPVIAMANQKNYISIYICSIVDNKYLAEKHKDKLGKVSVGKSCIRFRKMEDLNLKELKNILNLASKNPGLK